MKSRRLNRLAAGAIACMLAVGGVGGTQAWAVENNRVDGNKSNVTALSSSAATLDSSSAIPKVIQQTSPSVVAIIGKYSASGQHANRFDLAHGTGVVVKADGTIITNAHVVKDLEQIVVVTHDGKQYNAVLTHIDEESDLALVKVQAAGLQPVTFASQADAQVGETVIAIGTPISFSLRNSVTVGVISGLDRSINSTYRLLQTDAAINAGSSGGALVNLKGEVVGINTLKVAEYGVDNLGFAIPADTVQYVLKHFQQYGKVKRPFAGLELEESWASVVGLPTDEPLLVTYVEPGSPAEKAGIRIGDRLLSVGSESFTTTVGYHEALKRYLPGESAIYTVQSRGQTEKRNVTFGEKEQGAGVKASQTQSQAQASLASFDVDAGKTRIGDSQYGWSMKYPSGLFQYRQSSKGDWVSLGDVRGEYSLYIQVEDTAVEYSKTALLRLLAGRESDNTILDRKYVESKTGPSYARVTSKGEYGYYYETRAYSHGEKVYYVTLTIYDEANFRNTVKRKGYSELLDSFSLTFNPMDKTLKDLAVSKDGYTRFKHNDYGYSLSLPADWRSVGYGAVDRYTNENSTRSVEVLMASMAEGDSLDKWANRVKKRGTERFVAEYIRVGSVTDTKAAGLPAKEWTVSYSLGDKWTTEKYIFVVSQGYKYRIVISYPMDTAAKEVEAITAKVKESFQVNGNRNVALGYMEDEEDLIDYTNKVTVRNKTYPYKLEIPEFWEPAELSYGHPSDDMLSYDFLGGSFSILADEEETYQDMVKDTEAYHKANKSADSNYKYVVSDEKVLGGTAKKFVVHYKTRKGAYEYTQYVLRRNGVNYLITLEIHDAVRTESNVQDLRKAFESIRFISK